MSQSTPPTTTNQKRTTLNLYTPSSVSILQQALQYCHAWDAQHGEINTTNYYAHPKLKQQQQEEQEEIDDLFLIKPKKENNNDSMSENDNDENSTSSSKSNSDNSSTTSSSPNEDTTPTRTTHPTKNDDYNTIHKEQDIDRLTQLQHEEQIKRDKQNKKSKKYQSIQSLIQQIGSPPTISFPLLLLQPQETNKDNNAATSRTETSKLLSYTKELHIPSAFLTKHELRESKTTQCQLLLDMVQTMSRDSHESISHGAVVVVLLLQSGRFTGAIFQQSQCLVHTTFTKYTQRKKQGKSQSSMDNSKGKANSMGAQLRRAGEIALQQNVQETMESWTQQYQLQHTACCILVSCPPTMMKQHITDHLPSSTIPKVRKIPLNYGKPTYESACAIYQVMMQLHIVNVIPTTFTPTTPTITATSDTTTEKSETTTKVPNKKDNDTVQPPPLTPLHTAAAEGNVELVKELLSDTASSSWKDHINACAGPDWMTPLHYAAMAGGVGDSSSTTNTTTNTSSSSINAAAECVSLLLLVGHANPCIVDVRNRVPYYVACHDKVRDAFRIARNELGEDYLASKFSATAAAATSWDVHAKVGPPLSQQSLQERKQKAADKKKRQRARQKEKKAMEKQKLVQEEEKEKELQKKKDQQEEAKRIRDGLQPKKSTTTGTTGKATLVCDFCQTPQKGKRKSQLFERLGYIYCSTECVQKHKRELMAKAAMERFK